MQFKKLTVVTESGMMLAAALALSHFKLYQLPNGGSISLGTLPILLLAARHGMQVGIISGGLMGILLLSIRPIIVHPVQFLLDYPLAYGALGLGGAFKWESPLKATSAITIANLFRLTFHVIAGAVFFVENTEKISKALMFSFTYNISHILPETIICALLASYLSLNHKTLCARQKS
jgi:thiamine transporter